MKPTSRDSSQATVHAGSFYGIGIVTPTIFVLDTSGSMRWGNRIEDVKNSMIQTLGAYPENDPVAIVTFNSQAQILTTWTLATPEDIAAAQAGVDALPAVGHTNYVEALEMVLSIMDGAPNEVSQVIFLTDGKPQASGNSTEAILAKVDEIAAAGAALDTVGFKLNHVGAALLQEMASHGNGSFSEIDD